MNEYVIIKALVKSRNATQSLLSDFETQTLLIDHSF